MRHILWIAPFMTCLHIPFDEHLLKTVNDTEKVDMSPPVTLLSTMTFSKTDKRAHIDSSYLDNNQEKCLSGKRESPIEYFSLLQQVRQLFNHVAEAPVTYVIWDCRVEYDKQKNTEYNNDSLKLLLLLTKCISDIRDAPCSRPNFSMAILPSRDTKNNVDMLHSSLDRWSNLIGLVETFQEDEMEALVLSIRRNIYCWKGCFHMGSSPHMGSCAIRMVETQVHQNYLSLSSPFFDKMESVCELELLPMPEVPWNVIPVPFEFLFNSKKSFYLLQSLENNEMSSMMFRVSFRHVHGGCRSYILHRISSTVFLMMISIPLVSLGSLHAVLSDIGRLLIKCYHQTLADVSMSDSYKQAYESLWKNNVENMKNIVDLKEFWKSEDSSSPGVCSSDHHNPLTQKTIRLHEQYEAKFATSKMSEDSSADTLTTNCDRVHGIPVSLQGEKQRTNLKLGAFTMSTADSEDCQRFLTELFRETAFQELFRDNEYLHEVYMKVIEKWWTETRAYFQWDNEEILQLATRSQVKDAFYQIYRQLANISFSIYKKQNEG